MEREKLSSRLGFILLSVGCAVGLGNVWRFPFITGQYGGALFVLIYLVCLVLLGIPIITMEFAVGRASNKSVARSFHELQPKGSKWHLFSWAAMAGNYILMMFYTTVSGWMIAYLFKTINGDFVGLSPDQVGEYFGSFVSDPVQMISWMIIACLIGFAICASGLVKGVEKIAKIMMSGLFIIMIVLIIRSLTLQGASEGLVFYLKPNFDAIRQHGIGNVIYAAMGQAFFTLSVGIGSMAIFGSYINRDKKLFGESITITILDASVAIMAGFIIFPACFAFGQSPGSGPGLLFVTLPNIFNNMAFSQFWGILFFLFLTFAAMSTVIAVFENIISFAMDITGCTREKSCMFNLIAMVILSLPCALGFNLLSGFAPMGEGSVVLDLEDFILSNNILPLGALVYVLFCVSRKGWGWDNFLKEANIGNGLPFPAKIKFYLTWCVPLIIIAIFILGYIDIFKK